MNGRVASIPIAWLFSGAIGLLIIVSAIALASSLRLMNQYEASDRSHHALLELDRFLSAIKDIESGARGYAVTRDSQFLDSYQSGRVGVRQGLQRLHRLAESEGVLARRLPDLDQAAGRRISISAKIVDLVESGSTNGELRVTASEGRRAMDDVREIVAKLIYEQQQTYAVRRQAAENQTKIANLALVAGVLMSLAGLMWLFARLNREANFRREVERDLRSLNAELEQRVQDRTREVEENRHLLNEVVENLPDMVLLKKRKGNGFEYMLVNAVGEKLLGRKREEVIGKTEHDLFPAEEALGVVEANQSVLESGRARTFSERKLTTPNGTRTVETRMVPIQNGSGLLLAIVRDVTEHKSLEQQVREMQRIETVGRLTGGVAHDFNNLLAVILGSVELLRERLEDGSEAASFADEAINASVRGADLVRRLLAFARKQHLEPSDIDLNERIPNVVPLLQRTLGENIELRVKPANNLWHARIDPTQVDDALVNMAINARDAMPSGGMLTIETANVVLDEDYAAHHVEVEPGEYVMLAVSDTGTGMSADTISRAFEPFFTTKKEGEGTGLGLSQVFGWVKQSGGHIKIYSELGHGTTFKLYLPRASGERNDDSKVVAKEQNPNGHETILVVEDNPNLRRTVVRQLKDLGYTPIDVGDAKSALEVINSGVDFDVMLTDVVMPGGMNGYELADAVEKRRPSTRIVFMSGYTELAASGLQTARIGPLLSKPYTKRDLGRAIRSALDDEGDTEG